MTQATDKAYARAALALGRISSQALWDLSHKSSSEGRSLREALLAQGAVTPEEDARILGGLRTEGGGAAPMGVKSARLLPTQLPGEGDVLGGYRVVGLLARGGMGAVYRAQGPDGSEVALKVLLAGLGKDSARERFRREGHVSHAVRHPALVEVLDQGVEGDLAFLVIELVPEARRIDAYAHEEGLDLEACVRLVIQVAEGLQAAHDEGLIHRDLKPANVLVSGSGQVKVVDFGLARHIDEERLTQSGAVMGTLYYMAPEQVRGDTSKADARTDVFSLGVLLYQLVSERLPFTGEGTIQVMHAILRDEPVPPSKHVPAAACLDAVIGKALAKDPADRYASVAALGRDLVAAISDRGGTVAGRERSGARWRRAAPLILVALAVFVLGLGAWSATWGMGSQAQRERGEQLLGDVWRVAGGEAPLSSAVGEIESLVELGRSSAEAAPDPRAPELERALQAIDALQGLSALAGAEGAQRPAHIAEAQAASARWPPDAEGALLEALRAALALETGEEIDGGDVARKLTRARSRGFSRPALRGWLARARVSAGLSGGSAAAQALAELKALESTRPLRPLERTARVEALLSCDLASEAKAALKGFQAPIVLRWRVALAEVRASLEARPGEALAALAGLPAPGPVLPERAVLAKRARTQLSLSLPRDGPPAKAERRTGLVFCQIAHRLQPGQALPKVAFARLLEASTDIGGEGDSRLAAGLAALRPTDRKLQARVGTFSLRVTPITGKRRLLPALRRAIRLSGAVERESLECLLCEDLAEINDRYAHHMNPFECRECVKLAGRLLTSVTAPERRAGLLASRSRALRRLGLTAEALRDIERARELHPNHTYYPWFQALALRDLGRKEEALVLAVAFLKTRIDTTHRNDRAMLMTWELCRDLKHYQVLRRTMRRWLRSRPGFAGWRVRYAWALCAAGRWESAGDALRASLPFLSRAKIEHLRARIKGLIPRLGSPNAAAEADLNALVAELERKRGTGATP